MVLYPIMLSQSWSTTVPNFMLVSRIAQSGQILALSRLAKFPEADSLVDSQLFSKDAGSSPVAFKLFFFFIFFSSC